MATGVPADILTEVITTTRSLSLGPLAIEAFKSFFSSHSKQVLRHVWEVKTYHIQIQRGPNIYVCMVYTAMAVEPKHINSNRIE